MINISLSLEEFELLLDALSCAQDELYYDQPYKILQEKLELCRK